MVSSVSLLGNAVFLLVFAAVLAAGSWLLFPRGGLAQQTRARLRELSRSSAPRAGHGRSLRNALRPLLRSLSRAQVVRARLKTELRAECLRAGLFDPSMPFLVLAARAVLSVLLTAAGVGASFLDLRRGGPAWPPHHAGGIPPVPAGLLLCAVAGFAAGFLAPTYWLSRRARSRQQLLRHALPDALDILILCLEGGLTVPAALQRVTDELHLVHPALALEMNIVQREIELGLSPGTAFRKFADRCGLADARDLAVVLLQSERYGTRVTQALRTYVEEARLQRRQQAEEAAQRAAVKILFPTMLCIFPAILIVVLAPAAYQMAVLFSR